MIRYKIDQIEAYLISNILYLLSLRPASSDAALKFIHTQLLEKVMQAVTVLPWTEVVKKLCP